MAVRKYSTVRETRRIAAGLDDADAFGDLLAAAFLFAEIADGIDERANDRIRAAQAWRETIDAISARIAERSREVAGWASQRPRAV